MKPILFNTDMVRAILEDRKTVTRRVVKPQPFSEPEAAMRGVKMPYRPGDILYVRETWAPWSRVEGITPTLHYKADGNAPDNIKWRPSIHMPREAARIFLRVTNVRVERLQDITITGLQDDGVLPNGYISQFSACTTDSFELFQKLWDSTIKPADCALYGWDANPWVWVIEFERISRKEAVP